MSSIQHASRELVKKISQPAEVLHACYQRLVGFWVSIDETGKALICALGLLNILTSFNELVGLSIFISCTTVAIAAATFQAAGKIRNAAGQEMNCGNIQLQSDLLKYECSTSQAGTNRASMDVFTRIEFLLAEFEKADSRSAKHIKPALRLRVENMLGETRDPSADTNRT